MHSIFLFAVPGLPPCVRHLSSAGYAIIPVIPVNSNKKTGGPAGKIYKERILYNNWIAMILERGETYGNTGKERGPESAAGAQR